MTGARITQRDIAAAAKVSQATVSLVLNGRDNGLAAGTRERVLAVIRETGYVPNPVARQLQGGRNRILGVFTYESVFPSDTNDFYHPFFVGIEQAAESLGLDLLLFTSATRNGRRRVFGDENRLRLADGCVLLGRRIDREELARLNSESYPFVAVGRRDDAGGPVPFVGADYPEVTGRLVARARALGHERFAFVGDGARAEGSRDRFQGFLGAAAGVHAVHLPDPVDPDAVLDRVAADDITAVMVEEVADAVALRDRAVDRGVDVPSDLSVVALGDPTTPVPDADDLTGFRIPREQMGRAAVEVLMTLLDGTQTTVPQRLLTCDVYDGRTLAAPTRARAGRPRRGTQTP